jgi:SAM-dependent methyltransferase
MGGYADIRQIKICRRNGISFILDFGCGEGRRVYQLRDEGYRNAFGFNKADYLGMDNPVHVRRESDRDWFYFSTDGKIPCLDNTFDLVMSDQVFEHVADQAAAMREIYRVLKPGGAAVHVIPAKWQLIEPHIRVPLGGFVPFKRYGYYYLWALLGVRNNWQRGKSAKDTARENLAYASTCLNYLSCWQYRRLLSGLSIPHSWKEVDYMQTSFRPQVQRLGAICQHLPLLTSLIRTFVERTLFIKKPSQVVQ